MSKFVVLNAGGSRSARRPIRKRWVRLAVAKTYTTEEVERFAAKALRAAGVDPATVLAKGGVRSLTGDVAEARRDRQAAIEKQMADQADARRVAISDGDGAVTFADATGRETGRTGRVEKGSAASMASVVFAKTTEPYTYKSRGGRR